MDICDRIAFIRKKLGLSQIKFSEQLEVKRGTYALWETGQNSAPVSVIAKIAKLGNVSIDWLVTGEEAEKDDIVMNAYNKLDASSQAVVLRLLLRLATGDEDEVLPLQRTTAKKRGREDNGG